MRSMWQLVATPLIAVYVQRRYQVGSPCRAHAGSCIYAMC